MKKVFYLIITIVIVLSVSSCTSSVNVKLYCIKDVEYFNHSFGYVEVVKEIDSSINDDDLKNLYRNTHGLTDEEIVISSYEIYSDKNLKNKLDKDYSVKNNDVLYIHLIASVSETELGPISAESSFSFTGLSKPSDVKDNLYYPFNSLSVKSFYIPLESNVVSFDQLYDFYFNYRRLYGLNRFEEQNGVDLSLKEKFSFSIGEEMISMGESYTFGNDVEYITVYYDDVWYQLYMYQIVEK